jgi:uncharacterized protein
MNAREDYYVYCYIDPRNYEEFYFGKGRGSRSLAHLLDQGDSEKAQKLKQIRVAEVDPIIRIVATALTEEQALLVETALIWKLGKRLTNKNAGRYVSKFRPQNTLHKRLVGFDFSRCIHFFNVGEFGTHRSWDDCLIHEFLSAGYGSRYKRAAQQLQKGDVVAAYLSRHGYVGLGQVVAEAVPAREFRVGHKPLSKLRLHAPDIMHDSDDLEKCEYGIKTKWLVAKKREDAVWKRGLFRARQTRVTLENQPKTLRYIEQQWEIRFEDVLDTNGS